MQHFYELQDFPIKRMIDGFKWNRIPPGPTHRRDHLSFDLLSTQVLVWFAERNLDPTMIAFFQRNAPHNSMIHTDYSEQAQMHSAINFELEGSGAQAYYKQVRGEGQIHQSANNGKAANHYNAILYKDEDMELLDQVTFAPGAAYLVQVDVPHRAVVLSPYRVTVSIRFKHQGQYESWPDTVKRIIG